MPLVKSSAFTPGRTRKGKERKPDGPLARKGRRDVRAKAGSEKFLCRWLTPESKPFARPPLVNIAQR